MNSSAPKKDSSEPVPVSEVEAIAQLFLDALAGVRVLSLSLHDENADVLWLTEGVLGPDEHEAVRASLEVFAGEGAPLRHEYDLGDGRMAVTLRAGHGSGSVAGVVMAIVDRKAAMSQWLGLAAAETGALREPLARFALWVHEDVSATQRRLLILPELMAEDSAPLGLELEIEPAAPVPSVPAAAAPSSAAPSPAAPSRAANAAPAPAVRPTTPASPQVKTGSPAAPSAAATPVNPQNASQRATTLLERHLAALRAQPIVLYAQRLEAMASSSRIRRFEILLRSGSEHGREHAPKAMLDAAVKNGLGSVVDQRVIVDLLRWLVRNADTWRKEPIVVSVNLSSNALNDPAFFKFLGLCLAKADLPRGMIAFELDANASVQDIPRTEEAAQLLAALGCALVLDNFELRGGHVDLLGLKGLRMLKMHPNMTTQIGADKRRQAVVAGIAQMACVLGMHTCAKAIESNQDRGWLAALRVDFAQGFGFARPEPLTQLAATPGNPPAAT